MNDTACSGPLVLRASKHRQMPWKNGLGVTTEIQVFPAGATLDDFAWRVSMATVASDGAFSTFAAVDRTLSVLSGDGITLVVDADDPVTLTRTSKPFSFPADASTQASLLNSKIVDLNVMTRRNAWRHHVTRMTREQAPTQWLATAEVSMWFCNGGQVAIHDDAGFQVLLDAGDALVIEHTDTHSWSMTADSQCDLILIELNPIHTQ